MYTSQVGSRRGAWGVQSFKLRNERGGKRTVAAKSLAQD